MEMYKYTALQQHTKSQNNTLRQLFNSWGVLRCCYFAGMCFN